jgi:hypothetical protein
MNNLDIARRIFYVIGGLALFVIGILGFLMAIRVWVPVPDSEGISLGSPLILQQICASGFSIFLLICGIVVVLLGVIKGSPENIDRSNIETNPDDQS